MEKSSYTYSCGADGKCFTSNYCCVDFKLCLQRLITDSYHKSIVFLTVWDLAHKTAPRNWDKGPSFMILSTQLRKTPRNMSPTPHSLNLFAGMFLAQHAFNQLKCHLILIWRGSFAGTMMDSYYFGRRTSRDKRLVHMCNVGHTNTPFMIQTLIFSVLHISIWKWNVHVSCICSA